MSVAAIIPAVLQVASGVASGVASMEQNAADKSAKRTLEQEAAKLARLAAPLERELVLGYLPGGELSRLLEGRETGRAARSQAASMEDETREAWRYGGPGYGRAAGFLSASPYRYLMEAAGARAAGRTASDKILADLYLAGKDQPARPEISGRSEGFRVAGELLRDLASRRYES